MDPEEQTQTGMNDQGLLPPGWVEHIDPKTNKPYYHHIDSEVVQWFRPGRPMVQEMRSVKLDDMETALQETTNPDTPVDNFGYGRPTNSRNHPSTKRTKSFLERAEDFFSPDISKMPKNRVWWRSWASTS